MSSTKRMSISCWRGRSRPAESLRAATKDSSKAPAPHAHDAGDAQYLLPLNSDRVTAKPAAWRSGGIDLPGVAGPKGTSYPAQLVHGAVQREHRCTGDGVRVYRHEAVGDSIYNHLLTVVRDLDRRPLAERRRVGEVRGRRVQINGGCPRAVHDLERTIRDDSIRVRIGDKSEHGRGLVFRFGTKDPIQAIDPREVAKLLRCSAVVVELANEFINYLACS